MNRRPLWVFVLLIGLSVIAALAIRWRVQSMRPKPEVAIQDGKTLDFSSGRAVVKDSAKEKAIIDKSVKEMEEASKGVTFSSPQPAAKKAETKK